VVSGEGDITTPVGKREGRPMGGLPEIESFDVKIPGDYVGGAFFRGGEKFYCKRKNSIEEKKKQWQDGTGKLLLAKERSGEEDDSEGGYIRGSRV